jgi:hypothetical protein
MMRKCNNGLDPDNDIVAAEGKPMPKDASPLTNPEIETIRQWILYGAKQTGVAIDTSYINKYYSGKGKNYTTTLAPPAPGQGFQIHYGPLMLPPKTETENFLEYKTYLPDSTEVYRLDLQMNKKASHHFLLHKFAPGADGNFTDGYRPVTNSSNSDLVNAWQTPYNAELPQGTAFRWNKNAVMDLNSHCFNYDADSVVLTDVRMNVYTQPNGTAQAIMYTDLIHNLSFYIPNDNTNKTFTKDVTFSQLSNMYIWTLSSHTHKYGIDFDIYLRNPGGGKGAQVFEGFYDFDYTFNQGYYDWEHPPVRKITPFLQINPKDGLVMEAVYRNNGPKAVGFGTTTDDEMMLMFIQYTVKNVSVGTGEIPSGNASFSLYPNPSSGTSYIGYNLENNSKVSLEVLSMIGEKVAVIAEGEETAGYHTHYLKANEKNISEGVYFIRLTINGTPFTQKLIVAY